MVRRTDGLKKPVLLLALLVLVPSCGKKNEQTHTPIKQPEFSKYKVSGQVTYNGKPVPYGYVLCYSLDSTDPSKAQTAPPTVGKISKDGRYELSSPTTGPVQICVATDPDVDPSSFYTPVSFAPPGGGLPGQPGSGPAMIPGGGPPGGFPGSGPPMPPGGGPPGGFPGGGPPMPPGFPGGQPPMPPGGGPPGGLPGMPKPGAPNPDAEKLTEEDKKMLKEIHAKHGSLKGGLPVGFHVTGESDQTFDINLTSKPTSKTR